MYSVVLMMALSGSADVPAFGHRGGCSGCSGYSCGGCSGMVYSGCSGCYGSCSGSCHGGRGGLFGHHKSHGCCGGGRGGLFGHHRSHGCCGGYSCSGYSCSGYSCSGYGCSGYGCSGYGCSGSYGGCTGGVIYAPAGAPAGTPAPKTPEKVPAPKKETMAPAPATIMVSLPAEAKLLVDDVATKSTSATRLFVSPALQPGMEYFYNLKAEVVRDGKPVSVSRKVAVRAGEETRVSLELPVASVASK